MSDTNNNNKQGQTVFYTLVTDDILSHMLENSLNKYSKIKSISGYMALQGRLVFSDDNDKTYIYLRAKHLHGNIIYYSLNNSWIKLKYDSESNIKTKLVTPNVFIADATAKLDKLVEGDKGSVNSINCKCNPSLLDDIDPDVVTNDEDLRF